MDISRIEHTIRATRKLPPEERCTWTLSLPSADTMAAARREATVPGEEGQPPHFDVAAARREATVPGEEGQPPHFDGELYLFAYLGRIVRGVRGLVRDGVVVEMGRDLDLADRIAWLRANLPSRWARELIQAAESEEDVDQEEERSGSASPR